LSKQNNIHDCFYFALQDDAYKEHIGEESDEYRIEPNHTLTYNLQDCHWKVDESVRFEGKKKQVFDLEDIGYRVVCCRFGEASLNDTIEAVKQDGHNAYETRDIESQSEAFLFFR
jgi:hypothetical protein